MKLLWQDLKGKRAQLAFLAVLIIATKIVAVLAPRVAGMVTDQLASLATEGSLDQQFFMNLLILLAAMYAFVYALGYVFEYCARRTLHGFLFDIRSRCSQKIDQLKLSTLVAEDADKMASRAYYDADEYGDAVDQTKHLLSSVPYLIGIVVMMLLTEWHIALVYLVTFPLGVWLSSKISARVRVINNWQRGARDALNESVLDTFENHRIVKMCGCQDARLKIIDRNSDEYHFSFMKASILTSLYGPLSVLLNNLAYVLMCVIGSVFLIQGTLTIGGFQAFLLYGNMIGSPLNEIITSISRLNVALSAGRRMHRFLNLEDEDAGQRPSGLRVRGTIEFKHVDFGYTEDVKLMKDVSLAINHGMRVAVVGPSGAGKTTLIKLLTRFYDVNEGSINLDGKDLRSYPLSDLRAQYGVVPQEVWTPEDTITDIIKYGKPDASDEEVLQAARVAQCDAFVRKLPKGYDTLVKEGVSSLSAGEMQLIAIARAILADAPILIFDEATSKLDSQTEELVNQAAEHAMAGRTTILIAHRLYSIRTSDLILYMENGNIVEVGTHRELMDRDEKYAALYRSQLESEEGLLCG